MADINRLLSRINYRFHDQRLLKQALTHRSFAQPHNERLEFLGDSILGMVITQALFARFPDKSEGELSRLRSHLVKGESLTEIATSLDLGSYLYLGPGELKSGGFRRASILADALEALIAAVYLDGGFVQSESLVLHLFDTALNAGHEKMVQRDPKTQLQEYLQAQKHALPQYTLTKTETVNDDQIFYITCTVTGLSWSTEGSGLSRRKAEQIAAAAYLRLISTNRSG